MEAVYPKVDTRYVSSKKLMFVSTKLRKLHTDGKYYLWRFYKEYDYRSENDVERGLNLFHYEVYLTIILGQVDPELIYQDGSRVFKLDPDQTPEADRLQKLITPRKP